MAPESDKSLPVLPNIDLALQQMQGRAAFIRLLRQAQSGLQALEGEMHTLKERAKVSGSPVCLSIERRYYHQQPNAFLRWKYNHHNQTWQAIAPQIMQMHAPLRRHYERLDRRLRELNTLAGMLYALIQRLQRHLDMNQE